MNIKMEKIESFLAKLQSQAKESQVDTIIKNLSKMKKGKIAQIWNQVQLLYRMVTDPKAAWKSRALAIGALVYLISPLDLIPDFAPGVGLLDDVAAILLVVRTLSVELEKYADQCLDKAEERVIRCAESVAEIEVQKHQRLVSITLLASIVAALLTLGVKFFLAPDLINILIFFRIGLIILTGYALIRLLKNLVTYKEYYDRLPNFLRKYLLDKGTVIIWNKVKKDKVNLITNGTLLGVLVVLNVLCWL